MVTSILLNALLPKATPEQRNTLAALQQLVPEDRKNVAAQMYSKALYNPKAFDDAQIPLSELNGEFWKAIQAMATEGEYRNTLAQKLSQELKMPAEQALQGSAQLVAVSLMVREKGLDFAADMLSQQVRQAEHGVEQLLGYTVTEDHRRQLAQLYALPDATQRDRALFEDDSNNAGALIGLLAMRLPSGGVSGPTRAGVAVESASSLPAFGGYQPALAGGAAAAFPREVVEAGAAAEVSPFATASMLMAGGGNQSGGQAKSVKGKSVPVDTSALTDAAKDHLHALQSGNPQGLLDASTLANLHSKQRTVMANARAAATFALPEGGLINRYGLTPGDDIGLPNAVQLVVTRETPDATAKFYMARAELTASAQYQEITYQDAFQQLLQAKQEAIISRESTDTTRKNAVGTIKQLAQLGKDERELGSMEVKELAHQLTQTGQHFLFVAPATFSTEIAP